MNLDTLLANAEAAFAATPADKFGRKSITERVTLPGGEVAECTKSATRSFRRGIKFSVQFKLDGKVIAKAALAEKMGERRSSNPALEAAFLQRAPELAADFAAFARDAFKRIQAKHPELGGAIPAYPDYREATHMITRTLLIDVCEVEEREPIDGSRTRYVLLLSEALLKAAADRYGRATALKWYYKTCEKLGDLTEAALQDLGRGDVRVEGKRDGRTVFMLQQRIMKWSPKGKPFHQFPARLYVDGKFTPEAAYDKLFKAAS